MRSYLFIQDPGFAALRRISPGDVPALFCIRELDLPLLPSRRARLQAWLAIFGAACGRLAPRRRHVDPAVFPR